MKDEITISRKELVLKLSDAAANTVEYFREKNATPQFTAAIAMMNMIFIGEIIKVLFDDEDSLEIEDHE